MRQLTYVRPNVLEWWDVPEPRLANDRDAIVMPLAVTRCDLDLYIANGSAGFRGPFAIGHETAGRVITIGDAVKTVVPGDLVIVPFQISCGACEPCRRGHTNACRSVPFRSSYGLRPVCGVEYGGALSDLLRVPFADHMLVKQPAGLALSQTAALADSAVGAFDAVAPALRQRPGGEVLIIGGFAQSVGLLAVQSAVALGSRRVVYIDHATERLAMARSFGAEVHTAPPDYAMEPIGVFPIVFDADATEASTVLAIRSTEPNGVCQRSYGGFEEMTRVPLRHMYGAGVTLRVGRVNARYALPDCLSCVAAGHYHPERVVTRQVRFDDAAEAIGDPTIRVMFLRDGVT